MEVYCLDCKEVKSKKGLYCKPCGYKHRKRPSGLHYTLHKENPTSFKKGHISWLSKKHHSPETIAKLKQIHSGFHFSPSTEFKKGQVANEKNVNWKGEAVGYQSLHIWLRNNYEKTGKCFRCKKICRTHYANLSHQYKRTIKDFMELCPKCHAQYDHKIISITNYV
jgi:hypothetical protein